MLLKLFYYVIWYILYSLCIYWFHSRSFNNNFFNISSYWVKIFDYVFILSFRCFWRYNFISKLFPYSWEMRTKTISNLLFISMFCPCSFFIFLISLTFLSWPTIFFTVWHNDWGYHFPLCLSDFFRSLF